MVRFLPILVVLFLGHAAAQDDGISACSAGCISQVFSDTTKLACAANDPVCACNSPDFWFAIRDCINQACDLNGQALDDQLSDAQTSANTQCDAAKAAAGVTAPSSTTSVPTTVPPQAPTSSPSPSPSPSPTTDTSATTAAADSTTGAVTSTSNSATTATTAAISTSKTSTTSAQTSASTKTSATTASSTMSTTSNTSNAASTSSSAAGATTSDSSSNGLGVAAKAGIGAGAGVALLLSAIIACYVLSKKRKAKRDPSRILTMQISRPLPGSGRQYAQDVEAAKMPALSTHFSNDHPAPMKAVLYSPSTNSSQYSPRSLYAPSRPSREDDHDVLGRRYEDMLPRTKPRTMI